AGAASAGGDAGAGAVEAVDDGAGSVGGVVAALPPSRCCAAGCGVDAGGSSASAGAPVVATVTPSTSAGTVISARTASRHDQ
ncbi:MAG: hypothetical protein AAGC66_03070, partial [Leifsonia sp.]